MELKLVDSYDVMQREIKRQAEFGCEPSWEDFVRAGADEQVKVTLQQVDEWAELHCPHGRVVLPDRPKRSCIVCWQELRGAAR